jgi:F-type H+-transporting ATPase subunit alpha
LEAFAQLGTDLDAATQAQLDRGYRMVELLKQPQYRPLGVVDQIMVIYAGTKGHLDKVPINDVLRWEEEFLQFIQDRRSDVWKLVDENKNNGAAFKSPDEPTTQAVIGALDEFNSQFKSGGTDATA